MSTTTISVIFVLVGIGVIVMGKAISDGVTALAGVAIAIFGVVAFWNNLRSERKL